MAGFKTHISFSGIMGIGYAGAAYAFYDVPIPTCVLAGGLCGVSGMMPDVDSDSGVPLRESMAFAAAVVPMMLMDRFRALGLSPESMILAGAGVYLIVRFIVAEALRKYTVHRGMFHSIPAAIIAAQLAFLLAPGEDVRLRIYVAGGVLLGYMSHLVLDEFYSVKMQRGRLRLKKSFGSAVKIFSANCGRTSRLTRSWRSSLSSCSKNPVGCSSITTRRSGPSVERRWKPSNKRPAP